VKILYKYVLKEHFGPLMFALTALTSLLLLNYVAKQFGQLVGKGLPWSVIGEFFLLSVPFTFAMTLPMAVLVSVLYAFSRLASENEITALKASGVSLLRILIPVLWGATAMAGVMIAFNDQVLPRANHRLRVLQSDIARKKPTFALREQVINEVSPGKLSMRAGHIDEATNLMKDVTIYDMSDPQQHRTILADSGRMAMNPNRRDLDLTLYNGEWQEVSKTEIGQLQRLFYVVNVVRVKDVANGLDRSLDDNYKSDREMSICEMQKGVDDADRESRRAHLELQDVLVRAARESATGLRAPPLIVPANPPGGQSLSIGRLYCRTIRAFGVSNAQAAEPFPQAAQPAQSAQPPQAARMPAPPAPIPTPFRTPAGSPLPPPIMAGGPPVIEPSMVIGAIDAVRTRITDSENTRDSYEVEIQKKFALAVACIVFVLLGAPIALRFPRSGVGLVIGVSLGTFALYYVGLIAGESLANRSILSPFWAMWAANVLFTSIGALLLARMGKEGATSRGGGGFGEWWEGMRGRLRRRGSAAPSTTTAVGAS
jgi:lipopolysaccharide export system permease protein